MKIFPEWKHNFWLFFTVLLVCFAISVGARHQQFETWEKTPAFYFVGDRPIMTTLDAPHFLRLARKFSERDYRKDTLQDYPSHSEEFQASLIPAEFADPPLIPSSSTIPKIQSRDFPLLSYLIAQLAPYFNHNYYLTGTMLIPSLASLFILPMGLYFFKIGVPVSGLLGGLVGTFASGYYMRSSIGRIDTDMLNIFFPVLASLLVLLASCAKTERSLLLFSAFSGLSLYVFQWWYFNSGGFSLAYFIILVFILFINQIRFRTILICGFLFVLCTHPSAFMSGTNSVQAFLSRYFIIEELALNVDIVNEANPAKFPNTMTTISEVDQMQLDEVFRRILSNTTLDWIGFFAFFVLAVFRWRVLLPLVPLMALGLLSFHSSNRFIMFLAPFIGIGLGWILSLGINSLFFLMQPKEVEDTGKKVKDKRLKFSGSIWAGREVKWLNWSRQGVLYLGIGVFFWLISEQTAISFVPGPSIHPRIYSTFLEVKKRVPKDSVLLTWWDYGYAIIDATGLATFHDGGSQFGAKTYFIARSLISADPDELYDITQYLATEGNRGIANNNTSPDALLQAVRDPINKPWDPIYLFFTADMTGKFGAISKLGSWDVFKGGSQPRFYRNLNCNKITNVEMNCRGANIDLKAGFINNQLALRRIIFIRNGEVLREQKFGHTNGFTLQLIVTGKNIVEVQLIDEAVFLSNYNQMFLLGRYRKDLFEEAYNASPFSRLYRIKY